MGVDMTTCIDCGKDIAVIEAINDRCKSCITKIIRKVQLLQAVRKVRYDKATLIEASYRIASEMFKKLSARHNVDFNRGFVKASNVAHDVLKKMIEEAK